MHACSTLNWEVGGLFIPSNLIGPLSTTRHTLNTCNQGLCHCRTGGVAWAPLLCAVAYIAFTPSHAEAKQREAALVEQATARAQADLLNKMPVTPLETAGWMNRFNVEMWQPFWQPFLLKNNLTMWQVTSPLRHDPISRASDYLVWQQRKTVPHQVAVRVTAP